MLRGLGQVVNLRIVCGYRGLKVMDGSPGIGEGGGGIGDGTSELEVGILGDSFDVVARTHDKTLSMPKLGSGPFKLLPCGCKLCFGLCIFAFKLACNFGKIIFELQYL
mmetsp:Transcript_28831/g.75699  ORF Transcript_28831/g.75699 Transcript_28831/m.75699 type:complete len:108 (+) Transcript_28831:401-724(+)